MNLLIETQFSAFICMLRFSYFSNTAS